MVHSDLVLALDVGTTNAKAAVVDPTGHIVKLAHRPMTVERDDSGRAEHNPDQLFQAVTDCLTEASDGYQDRITVLVTATYQMGLIALGGDDLPLIGMMTLLDTRARETHAEMLQKVDGTLLYQKTGCPPLFHYPLAKLYWLKTKRPDLFTRITRVLSCKDYLLRRLTNVDIGDVSVSSTTQYMDIQKLVWEEEILGDIGVPLEKLPPVGQPDHMITENLDSARKLLKLPKLSGILLGTYDGGAVGIGLGISDSRTAVMNFGTSAMLRYGSDNPSLSTDGSMAIQSSCLIKDRWIPGGAINNAGAVLNWLSTLFHVEFSTLLAEAHAATSSGGVVFLPYLSGERSLSVGPSASGSFFGLRANHTRGQLVRAALEGVAFSLRRVYESVLASGFTPKIIRVGSGGSHSAVWMEIVSSVLGAQLQTTHATEPGLLGSAMLGYIATGAYPDLDSATREMVRSDRTYRPNDTDTKGYSKTYELFNLLTQKMKETDDAMSRL